jgi:SAM-dependent methyltransferase
MESPRVHEANADQAVYWSGPAGQRWIERQETLDVVLEPLQAILLDRAAAATGERVIDIGCGCGASSIALAQRVGPAGRVTALDISPPMRARARERAPADLPLTFVLADATVHAFEPGAADLLVSRFGVMFFADPAAAFAHMRRALKPGGRIAFCCWRDRRENPWVTIPVAAARKHLPELPAPPGPEEPGPFAFADSARIRRVLTSAGFAKIEAERFDPLLAYGPDPKAAADYLTQMGPIGSVLQEHPEALRKQVAETLAGELEPKRDPAGIRLAAAAWIVSARSE